MLRKNPGRVRFERPGLTGESDSGALVLDRLPSGGPAERPAERPEVSGALFTTKEEFDNTRDTDEKNRSQPFGVDPRCITRIANMFPRCFFCGLEERRRFVFGRAGAIDSKRAALCSMLVC